MEMSERYSYRVIPLNQAGTLTDLEFPIDGQKLIYAGPADGPELLIRLGRQSNDQIPLRPQGVIVAPFTRLYVSGVIGAALPSLIVASPAHISIESRDVNVGNIINPVIVKLYDLDRALNGQMFERGGNLVASVGNYTLVQLYNPPASGKTVIVLGAHYQCDGAAGTRLQLLQYNTALTLSSSQLYSVNSGGAGSVGLIKAEQPAVFPSANILEDLRLTGPWSSEAKLRARFDVLGPGKGLVIGALAVNVAASFSFRTIEL